ncbi:MAG: ECF transporter S component [Clostridiales bacterium]|jgi:uncharacterized membrane protein|nr:ECF transporter S component [Clostridiales bacterium]
MADRTISKKNAWVVAITGLMLAATALMSFTPLGTIVLPIAAITIAFLPAIITVMTAGLFPGLIVATFAGIFSLIRAFIVFTPLAPFLQNPLVSVMPRMLIVITAFLVFRALINTKLPKIVSIGISAAVGSITNTIGVLGMIWLLYGAPMLEVAQELGHVSVWAMIATVIVTNSLLEILGNTLIATAVVMALRKAKFSKF